MFTSKDHLHFNLGVDAGIAAFFVDRKVPVNNRYWKGKLLYVSTGTGYLFIPLYVDLQHKCGASKELILDEENVTLMEKILDSAAQYEFEEISFSEHLEKCNALISGRIKNKGLYQDLQRYFNDETLKPYKNLGTRSKALNRGDTLLFGLSCMESDEQLLACILKSWYALVPSFLLMDDITDLRHDEANNQENSVSNFGEGVKGVEEAIRFLREQFLQLKSLNQLLGSYFENSLDRKLQTPYLKSLLNDQ